MNQAALPTSHAPQRREIIVSDSSANAAMADAGRLVLRLTLGVLLLLHGISKLQGGVGSVMDALSHVGLPTWIAYVGEVVAPLLLIVGVWTRSAALVVVVNMVMAIALVHMGDLFRFAPTGGWALELQGFYLFGAVAIALLGAGRYSVGGAAARFN